MAASIMRKAASMLVLLACTFTGLAGCSSGLGEAGSHQTLTLDIAGQAFTLQLALDDDQRYQGLSDVADIPADGGMLFVFPDAAERVFVMRRCLVPIDIAFLGPGGRVVAMHEMQLEPYDAPPSQLKHYGSGWPAQFAIELRQGSIRRLGLRTGMKIDLPLNDLKAMAQ